MEVKMKRFYRSTDDRKIAGVCGGLGEYFDLDPVFFRLFFLVFAFFGGIGLLAYLITRIMVPMKSAAGETAAVNRLRLSTSDRKIAGVCGGLGEFLVIDPVFFRAGFIVLAFVGGVGILLYLALWLVMPQGLPVSTADRDRPGSAVPPMFSQGGHSHNSVTKRS
jgi:phage shock protein PspC (stress-responsive transcriptional regulator)